VFEQAATASASAATATVRRADLDVSLIISARPSSSRPLELMTVHCDANKARAAPFRSGVRWHVI
jgi:hypothetical protein